MSALTMGGDNIVAKPCLIEPGIKYFLSETLEKCHQYKKQYYNNLINIFGFVIILGGLAMFIYVKVKWSLTDEELQEKEYAKKQYILSRIKLFNDTKTKAEHTHSITGLPLWHSEFDI